MKHSKLIGLCVILMVFVVGWMQNLAQETDSEITADTPIVDDCSELRFLMKNNQTPFDYAIGGGVLDFSDSVASITQTSALMSDAWADYWVFRVGKLDNTGKTPEGEEITEETPAQLSLDFANSELTLEVGLFFGAQVQRQNDNRFVTLTVDKPTVTYSLTQAGVYTLVVRRPYLSDIANIGKYNFSAQLDRGNTALGDITTILGQFDVRVVGGRQVINFNTGAQARVNANSIKPNSENGIADTISTRKLNLAEGGSIVLEEATLLDYSGGSFGANWEGAEGPLTIYVQRFDIGEEANKTINQAISLVGDTFSTNEQWSGVRGVWILERCWGFKQRAINNDGITFVAPIDLRNERKIDLFNYEGNPDCRSGLFIGINRIPAVENPTALCIGLQGIQPASEITLIDGVFRAELLDERVIEIQSSNISAFVRESGNPSVGDRYEAYGKQYYLEETTLTQDERDRLPSYQLNNESLPLINAPLTVTFENEDGESVNLVIDWINVQTFSYKDPSLYDAQEQATTGECAGQTRCIRVQFGEDDPIRTVTFRKGDNLKTLEALDDITQIVYADGEEYLLLSADEGYIELVTPADDVPTFNGAAFDVNARPNTAGYAPRQANNLGGECDAFPTVLPELNCAPNGHVNPANGNLWYSVTDHRAEGYLFDLALTRSYNSLDASLDSPFGFGWSTDFQLDYNLEMDDALNARRVTAENVNNYRVSLNLVFAPRGMIIYNAPTGSRQVFVRTDEESGNLDFYRSLTMPGWVLFRPNLRSGWELYQDNGLTIYFDRAGRMTNTGFFEQNRAISISYYMDLKSYANGPKNYGESNRVVITDSFRLRQLELYYNTEGHIYRSILRDNQRSFIGCRLADNCYETLYKYRDDGQLIEVVYPNRQVATYEYDAQNRLLSHNDPLAPVAQHMTYTYSDNGVSEIRIVNPTTAEETLWQTWTYTSDNQATVTDEHGEAQTIAFEVKDGAWDSHNASFTVLRSEKAGLINEYDWNRLFGRELLEFVITRYGEQTRRQTQYQYLDRRGILGGVVLSGIVKDGPTKIYEIPVENIRQDNAGNRYVFTSFSTSDPYGFTPDQLYGQINDFNFGDGRTPLVSHSDGSITFFPANVIEPNGKEWSLSRYTDSNRRNWLQQAFLLNTVEGATTIEFVRLYDYNLVGLVTQFLQARPQDGADSYFVRYQYDGLGRIRRIIDSELGTYIIEQKDLICAKDPVCREITVIDPLNAVTIYRFDGRNRLLEVRLQEDKRGELLRKTTYEYDHRDRLIAQIEYLDDITCRAFGALATPTPDGNTSSPDCLITTYQYASNTSNGISLTRTNPIGQTTIFEYDALGRVVKTTAENGLVTDYAYTPQNSSVLVTQTEQYSRPIITTYTLDLQQRLTKVNYNAPNPDVPNADDENGAFNLVWEFSYANALNALATGRVGTDYLQARYNNNRLDVTGISGTAKDIGFNQQPITYNTSDDLLGNLTWLQAQDQTNNSDEVIKSSSTQATYCTEPKGAQKVIYFRQSGDASQPTDCEDVTAGVDAVYWYDVNGRLSKIADEFGTRTFAYDTYTLADYRWSVTMTATSLDESLTYSWVMVYNLAGDLVQWTDDTGVTRFYEYDKVGRLLSVSTGDENDDATFRYTYNAIGQVVRQEDGRGRGMSYEYDARGNLVAKTDIVSGVSTTYTLNADNVVTQVQQGDDIIAIYAYEHPTHPLLLTSYTDRATRTHQFAWAYPTDLRNNSLTYTDPTDKQTRYAFNGLGQLRVAQDAMGNKYEWEYDDAGYFSRFTPPNSLQASDVAQTIQYAYQLETIPTYDGDNELLVAVVDNTNNRYQWRRTNNRTPSGQLAQFASPGVLANSYDPLGRLAQMRLFNQSNDLLYTWQIQRDQASQIVQLNTASDSLFGLTSDPLNRLRNVDNTRNSANYRYITPFTQSDETPTRLLVTENGTVNEYIQRGNQVEYRAEGKTQVYAYDKWGRLTSVTTTTCTPLSDKQRGCAGASDATDSVLTYSYDIADNLTSVDYGNGVVESFGYDANDNMTQYTLQQGDGQTQYTYHYDDANRLIAIDMPDGYRTYFFVVGELTTKTCRLSMTEELLTVVADREKACSDAQAFIDRYDHNVLGNLIAKAYIGYNKPRNADLTGNFEVPDGNSSDNLLPFTYTPLGLLQSFGASAQYSYSQDALNLLERYTSGQGGDTYAFEYEPSPLLNDPQIVRLTEVESSQDEADMAYTYDEQGRVASVALGTQIFNYTYEGDSYTIAHSENAELSVTRPNDWAVSPTLQVGIAGATYEEVTQEYTLTRMAGTAQIVTVYDQNLQPIRTEVTNNDALVYKSIFASPVRPSDSEAIFIISETRTFANDTEVRVDYEFIAPANNRAVQWNPTLPLASQTLTFVKGMDVTTPDLYAKDSSPVDLKTHRYFYEYDVQGNLTQVVYYGAFEYDYENPDATTTLKRILKPVVCASYEYDGANRLVNVYGEVRGETVTKGELIATYGYDAYNRLVSVNGQQIVYLNADSVPSFVFEGDNGTAINSLQTLQGGVLDGFGRYIPLDGQSPVTSENDVCHLGMLKGDMTQNGVLFDDLLVDPQTQLAFYGGRAYLPSIGRFMQRNPQGADLNGNLYQYVLRSPVVPMPTQRQDIGTGLRVLQEATALMSDDIPTAESILQANRPHVKSDDVSLFAQLQQDYQRVDQTIQDLITFPDWLAQAYNQPTVQYNIRTGELAWDSRQIVGQHNSAWTDNTRFDDPFWGREWGFTDGITQPKDTLAQLLLPLQPDFYAPTTNPFNVWQAQKPQLGDIFQRPQVNIGDDYTLKSIMPRLLSPWLAPQSNAAILDLTQAIREQVMMNGVAWTAYQLDANLPDLPSVPLPRTNNWYVPMDLPNRQKRLP